MKKRIIKLYNTKTVFIIAPAYDGSGPARGAVSLLRLLKRKYNVELIFSKKQKLHLHTTAEDNITHMPNYVKTFIYLCKRIKADDTVISFCIMPDFINIVMRLVKFHHCVVSIRAEHTKVYSDIYGRARGQVLAKIHDYMLTYAKEVLVMNKSMLQKYSQRHRAKMKVIRNFDYDLQRYRKFSYNENNAYTILIVARLTLQKVDVRQFKYWSESSLKISVIKIYGIGRDAEEIIIEANKYFPGRVQVYGFVPNPFEGEHVNPVLSHFSIAEGFPRSILEASMCDMKVFASRLDGFDDYCKDLPNVCFIHTEKLKDTELLMKHLNKKAELIQFRYNESIAQRYDELLS